MAELPPEIEAAIAGLSAEDFAALAARTRPPEDYDPAVAAKARAVQAIRSHRTVDPELAAGLANTDPEVRKAFAKALLSSGTGNADEAKRAAAAAMREHRATSPTASHIRVAGAHLTGGSKYGRGNAEATISQYLPIDTTD